MYMNGCGHDTKKHIHNTHHDDDRTREHSKNEYNTSIYREGKKQKIPIYLERDNIRII